ncbi:MAG: iron transporter substrate-binding protein [Marmoricola sp.]|nr:iron transporter substrate-binding protein [Marmoricola sp.]
MRLSRLRPSALLALLLALPLVACGAEDSGPSLVVYNAQHEELIDSVARAFTKKTGIRVQLRNGSDLELGNQLATEGAASPADVFLTENSPAMTLVDSKNLFARLDESTLAQIPAQYRPDDGQWTGFAARSTVLVYNTAKLRQDQLPASLMDLAEPQWKDRISFSPTGADFQAIVSAVLATRGEQAAKAWLAGLKANGTVYDGNNVVLESVNSGEKPAGVIYHYYWYRDQEESGENSDSSRLHFFGKKDPGAFISVSGAGVLKSSDDAKDAQKFVDYLVSKEGQEVIAKSYALEYPLNPEVDLGRGVRKLSELDPPEVDVSDLNSPKVVSMMQEAGFL